MSAKVDPWKELVQLLKEANTPIKFGLRAQGHIPTIERMLASGSSWEAIGKAIGWDPQAAKEWYYRTEAKK
jgi:hypothetical protein